MRTLAALLLCVSIHTTLHAAGILIPLIDHQAVPANTFPVRPHPPIDMPMPPPVSSLPFRITSTRIVVRIEENVATTIVEQSFQNLSGQNLEVRVLYPLPAAASIDTSSLLMNGVLVEGKLHNADEALRIYQSIVQQRKDPALLRYAGEGLFEARIFPVPPNESRRLCFSYTQLLTATAGLYDFKQLLTSSQHYDDGLEAFKFQCTIHSKTAIGPVYSASHQVEIVRRDANTAEVTLNAARLVSENDLRIYYALGKSEVAFRVLAHRTSESEDGYFMLLGRADESLDAAKLPSKELVFVVDTSGSMQGPKIKQTRAALKFCINSLSERDRFNLITFSTDVSAPIGDNLKPATQENVNKALAAVDQIEASGGTNIDAALRAALGSNFSPDRAVARMVVFMTDGLPTNGVTDMSAILNGIKSANPNHVRFFNFGVGDDVNTHLLDKLAEDQDGTSTYVSPMEDIEIKISDFYAKVKNPVMTEAAFDYGSGSGVNAIYPKKIPALFKGGEFILLGRYKGSGPGEVVLTGNVNGEQRRIAVPVTWPARTLDNSFLPRIWAMRKIGYLLESMRLNGANQEIINEVVELATRHGIVTPYTSQLVLEPGMTAPQPNRPIVRGGGDDRGSFGFGERDKKRLAPMEALKDQDSRQRAVAASAPATAAKAIQNETGESATGLANWEKQLQSVASNAVSNTGQADDLSGKDDGKKTAEFRRQATNALRFSAMNVDTALDSKYGPALDQAQQALIRNIGSRTFYQRGRVWVDSKIKPDAKPIVIKQFSPEYFDLLKNGSEFNAALALGGSILIGEGDKVYQIEE